MAIVKKSFLSNLLGRSVYDDLKRYALIIIAAGSCSLAVLFLLSFFFHWVFISRLLNLVTGTSLLFVVYVADVIIALDKEVDVNELDSYYGSKPGDFQKTTAYRLTIVWGVVLLAIGVSAVFFSNRYRKQYAFECSTILVDEDARIYHYSWNDDCELAQKAAEDLVEMKGYEIKGQDYHLCEYCKEYAEEIEDIAREESYSNL